jgi:FMN phosphatase YigB (HAD superfamily)
MIKTIFLDMDGVITDFEKAAVELNILELKNRKFDWNALNAAGARFWEQLEWKNEGKKLYEFLDIFCKDHGIDLCILSTVNTNCGKEGKKAWLKANTHINPMNIYIVRKATDKSTFAAEDSLLIDDFGKNVRGFIQAGGQAIKFENNAEEVIKKIKELVSGDTDNG